MKQLIVNGTTHSVSEIRFLDLNLNPTTKELASGLSCTIHTKENHEKCFFSKLHVLNWEDL